MPRPNDLMPVPNLAPTTIGVPNVNVNEDAVNTVIDLAHYFNDGDVRDFLTYSVIRNDHNTLFSDIVVAPNTGLLTLDYAPNANGSAHITVRATDSHAEFVDSTFTVTIAPVNDAPSFIRGSNPDFTIVQTANTPIFADPWPGTQTVAGWATNLSAGPGETIIPLAPGDRTNQAVWFEVQVLTNANLFSGRPSIAIDSSLTSASLRFTPNPQQFGTAVLRTRMHDDGGTAAGGQDTSDWQTFAITIGALYHSPQPKVRFLGPKTDIAGGPPATSSTSPGVGVDSVTGNFVTVWATETATPGFSDIFFRRYLANGSAAGSTTQVNTTAGANFKPVVGMDASGNFVVAWEFNDDIYARRFDGMGAPLGGQFVVNNTTAGSQSNAAIAVNLDGSFLVAWSSPDASGNGVFVRRFDSVGAAVDPLDVSVNTTVAGSQTNSAVAIDPAGDFVVVWQSPDAAGAGIFARRYDVTSATFGAEFEVNTTTSGNDTTASIGMDAPGNFAISWVNYDGTDSHIRFQRFDSSGTAAGSELTVATVTNYISSASTTMDADGDFVIAWDTPIGISGKRYHVDGLLDDTYTIGTSSNVELPHLASAANGDFVAIWQHDVANAGKIDFQQFADNEAPYDLTYAGATTLDETSDVGGDAAISGTYTGFDHNPDDVLTYSISGDDSGGGFAINATTGALSVGNPALIDFESAPIISGTQKAYSVTVRVTDSHILFRELTQLITVNDVNETPTAVLLDTNTPAAPIEEHSAEGTVVGNLSTSDPDSADDATSNDGDPTFSTFTYSLLDDSSDRFRLGGANNDEIQVNDAVALEYDDATDDGMGHRYFSIVVRSTDGGGLSHDETIRVYVAPTAETIVSDVRIGDDTATRHQRSRIEQLQVAFTRVIDLANPLTDPSMAFTLTRLENSATIALTFNWSVNDNGTPADPSDDFSIVTLTFASQPNVFGRSLVDGNYELHIDGEFLRDSRGVRVDGNGDGAPGGSQNSRFYRFFGDFATSGNYHETTPPTSWRTVDFLDLAFFRSTYGSLAGDPNFESAFDYDGDGDVDGFDLAQFRFRLGTSLPEFP